MGRREKPPKRGEKITSTFLTDVSRAAYESDAQRGHNRQIAGAGGMRKPLQPFLAIVTIDFNAPASAGADDASSGYAKSLFLASAGTYTLENGDAFECYSHHYLPIAGDRIWVTWNEQSGRFEMLAGSIGQIIRFEFIDFQNESELVANCSVQAADDGRMLGETVQVTDATTEGCFFGDETEAELAYRTGYAAFMQITEGSGRTARLEVFSLCCPAGS